MLLAPSFWRPALARLSFESKEGRRGAVIRDQSYSGF
jgi:hypothetical protein